MQSCVLGYSRFKREKRSSDSSRVLAEGGIRNLTFCVRSIQPREPVESCLRISKSEVGGGGGGGEGRGAGGGFPLRVLRAYAQTPDGANTHIVTITRRPCWRISKSDKSRRRVQTPARLAFQEAAMRALTQWLCMRRVACTRIGWAQTFSLRAAPAERRARRAGDVGVVYCRDALRADTLSPEPSGCHVASFQNPAHFWPGAAFSPWRPWEPFTRSHSVHPRRAPLAGLSHSSVSRGLHEFVKCVGTKGSVFTELGLKRWTELIIIA